MPKAGHILLNAIPNLPEGASGQDLLKSQVSSLMLEGESEKTKKGLLKAKE